MCHCQAALPFQNQRTRSVGDSTPSRLLNCFGRFLANENSAEFVESVSHQYGLGTLERLLWAGPCGVRRAAALAIGFLGEFENNEALGRALHDEDRGVRLLADHGLRQLWFRQGPPGQRPLLVRTAWLNRCGKHDEAHDLASDLIAAQPELAEAWNQRSTALAGMNDLSASVEQRKEVLYLNRHHFVAASCLAATWLQLDEMMLALEAFRLTLEICPDLENVRAQIGKLERIVGG